MALWVKCKKNIFFFFVFFKLHPCKPLPGYETNAMTERYVSFIIINIIIIIVVVTKSKHLQNLFFPSQQMFPGLPLLKCFSRECEITLELGRLDPLRWCVAAGFTCDEVHMLELEGDPDRFGKHEDGAAGLREQVQVELHGAWRFQQQVSTESSELPPPLGLLCSRRPGVPPPSRLWASPAFKQWRHFKVREAAVVERSDLWPRARSDVL